MRISTVLSDWSEDVREVHVYLLCLLQQSVHLLGQRNVAIQVFSLLGPLKTGSASRDDQQFVLLADPFPSEACQCPLLRKVMRRTFSASNVWR